MNEIDWTKHKLYVFADRIGLIETHKGNEYCIIAFEWFIDSCIDDWFNISIDFEPLIIYNDDTGEHIAESSERYQEYITDLIQTEINSDPDSLGLDNYLEDKYNFDE